MAGKKTDGIPAPLERTRQRFERWRQTRRRGTRIPERLWRAAVKMAGQYGVHRTAATLGVDYYALKKRAQGRETASRRAAKSSHRKDSPTFLELAPAQMGTSECLLELEKAGGAKMRVHLKSVTVPDLVSLSRGFWGTDS